MNLKRDLILGDLEYKDALKAHYLRSKKPTKTQLKQSSKAAEEAMRRGGSQALWESFEPG
jgi:hypothetical protein